MTTGRHDGLLAPRQVSQLPGGLGRNANEGLQPTEALVAEVLTNPGEAALLTTHRLLLVRAGFVASGVGKFHAFDHDEVLSVVMAPGAFNVPQLRIHSSRPAEAGHQLNVQPDEQGKKRTEAFIEIVRRSLNLAETIPDQETRSKLPGKLGEAINATLKPDEDVLAELTTAGEGLVVTTGRVLIVKGGYSAQAMFGQKVKSYPYGAITSVEVSAGAVLGRIQITVPGSTEGAGRFTNQAPTAQMENVVQINRTQLPEARRIANLIEEKMAEARSPAIVAVAAPATVSVADELLKLASLRDAGVLTSEEFAIAKVRLLGG